ncbi:uncharacterized protein LODBEIA_P43500 [Lodderomyces beijingensis]|uniref:Mitochondrial intermediate peptidase n=1 Tax=Lodderomyces beijingensis TaxID=1775926 RepID=A0ABP0ZT36_9ASCO
MIYSRICRRGSLKWVIRPSHIQVCRLATVSSAKAANLTTLRKVFDDQTYFNEFNGRGSSSSSSSMMEKMLQPASRTGLFKNDYLKQPQGLVEFSKHSKREAEKLVSEMTSNVHTEDGKLEYIKKLDQLSDVLCRAIDVAEFIRVVHDDEKWVEAAQQTHELIFEYMNQLNTNVELYANLINVLEDKEMSSRLSEEEVKVGLCLKQDFERSGIHMDPTIRDNFVAITQEISLMGSQFNNEASNLASYYVTITQDEYDSISNYRIRQEIARSEKAYTGEKTRGIYHVLLTSSASFMIMTNCESSELRKKIWIAMHNASEQQIGILNQFVAFRALLARMLGYQSFAHYQLEHKMAKSPKNVVSFLANLQQSLKRKRVIDELRVLTRSDVRYLEMSDDELIDSLKPWDRDYLAQKVQEANEGNGANGGGGVSSTFAEYFSVGTVIAGLSKLFTSLYGVSFVPQPTQDGEVWNATNVRKLRVVDNRDDATLGFLYLDFWSSKVLPSHFTIVCSRKLNASESVQDQGKLVQLSNDYQLPVISLVCNFSNYHPKSKSKSNSKNGLPTLLTFDQVDTIFHEMGHAMHSMIGRTQLHNLSGTRCATDFVEIPSVLMESFCKDSRVLSRIGSHYLTGEPVPTPLLEQVQAHSKSLQACETFMQSKMAMLDQKLHDENVVESLKNGLHAVNSTEIYHAVESQLRVFADKWSTWHGKFPHLFSYGAVYYSYLLDRAIADVLWQTLFEKDPWSPEAGNIYRESVLKWGGTRDPWLCLADALDNPELSRGDSHAMQLIAEKSNL